MQFGGEEEVCNYFKWKVKIERQNFPPNSHSLGSWLPFSCATTWDETKKQTERDKKRITPAASSIIPNLPCSPSSHLILTTPGCAQLLNCVQLCNPKDCSLPGSSVHGILQASMLEWVAISFSRGSSQPRDQTNPCLVSPELVGGFFTTSATWNSRR